MKFVIIGPALSGNKGAAAMLESSVQTLTKKYPNADFTLLSHYPSADTKLNTYKNLSIISATPVQLALLINPLSLIHRLLPFLRAGIERRHPAIKAIAEADAMLEEGGITFNDGREVFLLFNIATILPGVFLKTPVIKCAQALGPFKSTINNMAGKIFLPKMSTIVSRGEYTTKNLAELKLKNVVEGADYAFSLEATPKLSKAADPYLKMPVFGGKKKIVGVSPSSVVKKRIEKLGFDYDQIMYEFISGLLEKKYAVAILPHSMSDYKEKPSFIVSLLTGKSHNDDMTICKNLFVKFQGNQDIMLLDKEIGAQPLRKLIGACDLFVASRFHAMVASLAMEVPVMVVGWSHKYAEVLKMFDCEDLAFDFSHVTSKRMLDSFDQISSQQAAIKKKISKHLPQVKVLSEKHVDFISEVVERG